MSVDLCMYVPMDKMAEFLIAYEHKRPQKEKRPAGTQGF